MNKRNVLTYTLVFAGLIIISFFTVLLSHYIENGFNIDKLVNYINSFGYSLPLVLFIIVVITSSIGFVFLIPTILVALMLSFWQAVIINIVGLAFGAGISFYFARYFGRGFIEKRFVNKIKRLKDYNAHLERKGFWTVLMLRMISVIPFELVNVASGFSKMKFRDFFAGTLIGIIPGTLITVYFIKTLDKIGSWEFFAATALMAGFALIPLMFKGVRRMVFGEGLLERYKRKMIIRNQLKSHQ